MVWLSMHLYREMRVFKHLPGMEVVSCPPGGA